MKNSNTKMYVALGALALLLAIAPASAFADNEKNNKNRKEGREVRVEVKAERKNKSCLRAFGHLISPGWFKLNGSVESYSNCWMPFGISKKFQDNAPKPDVVAPTIKSVVASSTNSSVSVGWVTNEPATSKVLYGTSSPLNISSTSTLSVESTDLKATHLMTVPSLSANTQYYMIIQSKDAAGNIQASTEFSAKTGI